MTAPATIASMSRTAPARPRYGREIAARRALLGKSGTSIENETNGIIYPKLLSRLETGLKDPREITVSQLSALLKALEWTARDFETHTGLKLERFSEADEPPKAVALERPTKTRLIPVYDAVSAGPGYDQGAVLEWIELGVEEPGEVAYKVDGNSMEPDIPHGSTVIVKVGQCELGDVVVAWVPDTGMVVKRLVVSRAEHRSVLSSSNPDYGELIAEGAHIIGKVVQMRRDF
jgi:SOS-response transcriptional repressor LexA